MSHLLGCTPYLGYHGMGDTMGYHNLLRKPLSMGDLQDPKMEVPYFWPYFAGDTP
jgi:hypothetical protein